MGYKVCFLPNDETSTQQMNIPRINLHHTALPWQPNFMMILSFLSSTIPFAIVTSRHLLHMVFTCRSWFDIREPLILIRIFYIDLSC